MITGNKHWTRLLLAGCALVCMTACNQSAGTAPTSGYETMTVTASTVELVNSYSATIRGRQDIDIYPQVSGKIEQLCVTEGEKVKKGQLLFIIDQVPYKAALRTAEANVKSAEANVATAKLTFESNKELRKENVISDFTLSTSENSYLTAEAQLAQAEAQLVDAKNNLSYTEVRSPSNGVVGTLPYRVGTLVSASMAQPLTTVSDNSTMYVYFSMTENQLLQFIRAYGNMDDAMASMPQVGLRLNDGELYEKKGVIESISGVIDRQTGSVTVRAVFDNESRLLHSGASGTIEYPVTFENKIVIPQEATMQLQDKYLVYKVVDGKAVSALVTVAPISDGHEYIVTEGLTPGEEIIASGAALVREGAQVK